MKLILKKDDFNIMETTFMILQITSITLHLANFIISSASFIIYSTKVLFRTGEYVYLRYDQLPEDEMKK